jgi:hypothetical protein
MILASRRNIINLLNEQKNKRDQVLKTEIDILTGDHFSDEALGMGYRFSPAYMKDLEKNLK